MAARVALSPLAKETRPTKGGDTGTKRSDEPVRLKPAATPGEVDGKEFDVVVIGGTGGGVACAVRAAREGCRVLLVPAQRSCRRNDDQRTHAMGRPSTAARARPIFSEILQNIERYYIETFGRDSKTHQTIRCTHEHYPISWAEPHVAEREYNRLLAAQENITLLLDHHPASVGRDGRLIQSVALRTRKGTDTITVRGATFVDATYEGDLFALAGARYRVGPRGTGRIQRNTRRQSVSPTSTTHPPQSVISQGLNIRSYNARQGSVDPSSPFSADGAVQAYNYRFCVTSEPANRLPIPKPANYDRNQYVDYGRKYIGSYKRVPITSPMSTAPSFPARITTTLTATGTRATESRSGISSSDSA